MTTILVLGAGLAGLTTAGLLAGDGHDVTVLERDPAPPPPDAWTWERPGVNQFRLPHFMQPLWWHIVRGEFPAAVTALDEAGALRTNIVTALPEARRGPVRPTDGRFDTVTGRRPVLEAALAAAVAAVGVEVRRGVRVDGLTHAGTRVTGVVANDRSIAADLVVDCAGRRSGLAGWLAAIGAPAVVEERADRGFVYYARDFRGEVPDLVVPYSSHHASLTVLTLPTDHGTWSVVIATSSRDKALRDLRHAAVWDRVVAAYPQIAPWTDGEVTSDVLVLAGIEDTHRPLAVDGRPVATGVVAVGDSWGATNPSLGRGAAISALHARVLRDTLRKHGADDVPEAFHEATTASVEPILRATNWYDAHRLAEIDADIAGTGYAPDDQRWAMGCALYNASAADPDLTRAQAALAGVLTTPAEVFAEPGVAERVVALGGGPRYRHPGPTRAELLARLHP